MTRTVVREALIMLEIKGLVEVRRGAGIYVLDSADNNEMEGADVNPVMTPGLLNCCRRVSCWKAISLNLPLLATREDIIKMRRVTTGRARARLQRAGRLRKRRYAVSSGHCRSDP